MTALRYLVIGGAGLVGSHVVRALEGRDVTVAAHRAPVPGAVPLDITDAATVRSVVAAARPDLIVLAAADPYVERCEREPEASRRVNVGGTRAVADAAREHGAALVVFSSEYVFDGALGEYGEDGPTAPLNEYGRQKVEIEAIAREMDRNLVCRVSGVFGLDGSRKNFVLQLIDALRAGKPFTVPADQVVTPTYAPSLATAIVELLDRGERGTFHVTGPERVNRTDFARRVAAAFGLDPALIRAVPTHELGLAAPRPLQAGLRDDKLRSVLGHGLTTIDEALHELATEAQ